MRKYVRFALAIAFVLALTAVVIAAAWALPQNPYQSTISLADPDWPYSNQLTAEVTALPGGMYHYKYTLIYAESFFGDPLTLFSVGNMDNLAFTNQGCSESSFHNALSNNSVLWNLGNVPLGRTVEFWYDSKYSYKIVDVTLAGGLVSNGTTLGMAIPEPTSLMVVALGLGGVLLPKLRRKS